MTEQKAIDLFGHIEEAANDACSFVKEMSKDEFESDKRTQQAVIFSLIVIGEAATKIMDQFPDLVLSNKDMPWRRMRGMRNRIAHGYFQIDLDIIWDTIKDDMPELIEQTRKARTKM